MTLPRTSASLVEQLLDNAKEKVAAAELAVALAEQAAKATGEPHGHIYWAGVNVSDALERLEKAGR